MNQSIGSNQICTSSAPNFIVMLGNACIGKSQFTRDFIHTLVVRNEISVNDVFWINASTEDGLLDQFKYMCARMKDRGYQPQVAHKNQLASYVAAFAEILITRLDKWVLV